MLRTSPDLYPCGSRVKVPALGLTSPLPLTSDDERVTITREPSSQPSSDVVRDGSTTLPRPFAEKPRSLKRETISHLSSSLNFDGDVVSARCPETIPYSEAKQQLQGLLRPRTVRFEGLRNATVPAAVGRYDMRGKTKKHHTCSTRKSRTYSLHSSRRESSAEERKTSAVFRESCRALSLPKKDAKMGIVRSLSDSDITSLPLLERMNVVGRWQVAALSSVSKETARMFVDKVQGKERQWLEEFLQEKNESGHVMSSTVEASRQLTNDDILYSPPPHSDISLVQEATVPGKNDFVEKRQDVIPSYQKTQLATKDFIIHNNTKFNKVLQPAFPPMPSTWLESFSRQAKGRRTDHTSRSVKGYRKWKELPVRAPVSDMWHIGIFRYNCA